MSEYEQHNKDQQLRQLTEIAQMTYDHCTRDMFYMLAKWGCYGVKAEKILCQKIEYTKITLPPAGSSSVVSNPETPTPTTSSAPDQSPAAP